MGKVLLTEYNITNPLLKRFKRVASFADVHSDYKKLETIKDIIKELKVTTVLIQGDLIESVLGSEYSKDRIAEIIQEISKFASVIFQYGNHDTVYALGEPEEDRERLLAENYAYWSRLKDTENVFIPSIPEKGAVATRINLTDDIDVSTVSFPPDYYWFHEHEGEFEGLINILEDIKLDLHKYNILLAHSPKHIIKGNTIDERLKKYNLILSGHMHAGMIPHGLRKSSRVGFLGPGKSIFPNNSYGIVEDDNTISITTGGVTKISASNVASPLNNTIGVKQLLDVVYPPELEIYNLNPGLDKTLIKVRQNKIED